MYIFLRQGPPVFVADFFLLLAVINQSKNIKFNVKHAVLYSEVFSYTITHAETGLHQCFTLFQLLSSFV